MANSYYKQESDNFETYKISNNCNFNGNLTQVFQYIIRREHKHHSPAEDIKKAIDFSNFEMQRITNCKKNLYAPVEDENLINTYADYLKGKDRFAYDVFQKLLEIINTCYIKPQECKCGKDTVSNECKKKALQRLTELLDLLNCELNKML